ncbi:MAG: hypothetical protein WCO23_01085 [bacterium]
MKWIAISGSWRLTDEKVERDVRREVANIIKSGDGIVSGGALNVDYFATDEAMKLNSDYSQIKIFLPTTLEIYAQHYRKRADENVISHDEAEKLIIQLSRLKEINPDSLLENIANKVVDKTTYYERNLSVINAAEELLAFHVNGSDGVQDTIDKAKIKEIPIKIITYTI